MEGVKDKPLLLQPLDPALLGGTEIVLVLLLQDESPSLNELSPSARTFPHQRSAIEERKRESNSQTEQHQRRWGFDRRFRAGNRKH